MCRDFSFFKRRYFPLYMKVQKKLPFSNQSNLISLLLCFQKKKKDFKIIKSFILIFLRQCFIYSLLHIIQAKTENQKML